MEMMAHSIILGGRLEKLEDMASDPPCLAWTSH